MSDRESILETARERFRLAVESESRQREQEREDLRFQVPEEQWDANARKARAGDAISPARPMLSIDQLGAPIRLTRNQARSAKLGVNVHPISEDANEETAEVIQGLYRRIERDSNANTARIWALDRALKAGRGYYRVVTDYDEDSGETFDQEIRIERILYQDSVYLDPAAKRPDWSDGEWAFVFAWLPISTFKRQYPKAQAASITSALEWEGIGHQAPEWVRGGYDGDAAVLVAEYWYKVHETEEIGSGGQKRKRDRVTVYCAKITGAEVLEEPTLWNGRYIPIIPVLGVELQPFDERRRFNGMVTTAKDGQRLYNYAASSLVEGMALEPKAPFIGMEGQFEGHESQWQQANTRNFPYLEYKPVTVDGKPAPPPQRAQVDGTRMNLAVMALQESGRFIQQTTAVHEPSLGRLSQEQRSGRAILALQQQGDVSTGDFLANLAEVAMVYEARVVLDLMPNIYDRPGRITRIIRGDDDKSEPVALNAPFLARDGRVQVAPQGAPPPQGAKTYDLAKGRYGISIDVGKSYQTRLQEGDEALTRIVEAKPELLIPLGDIWFKFRDHPGAKEISKRLAKMRELQFPGLGEGEDGQPSPEQVQMKAQAQEQQLKQLQQQLQQAMQALQTDQAKQQAAIAKAQMDADTKAKIAAADNETKLTISAADNETKLAIAGLNGRLAALELMLQEIGAQRQQEAAVQERREGMAHEANMGVMAANTPPTAPEAPENTQEV
jgi:hypothetical protein